MMNNTILIIENEYNSVKSAFEAANLLEFERKLQFVNVDKAQSVDYSEVESYSAIFVDISLAQKSALDGYGIINKFKEIDVSILSKVIIITGNNKINETLKAKGMDGYNISIIIKPLGYKEIASIIRRKAINLSV